jgi:hypothetical protein
MVHLLAFSLKDQVDEYGTYIGIGAFFGLAILTLLYFAQAREVRRMREWAGRAPERLRELEERVIAETEAMQRFRMEAARRPQPRALSPATPAAARGGPGGDGATRAVPIPAPPEVPPARPRKPTARPVPIRPGGPIPKVPADLDGKPDQAAAAEAAAAASGAAAGTAAGGPASEGASATPASATPGGPEGPAPDDSSAGAGPAETPASEPVEGGDASAKPDEPVHAGDAADDAEVEQAADRPGSPQPVEASAAGLGQLGAPSAGEASPSAAAGAVAASAAARKAGRPRTARPGGGPPSNGAPRPGEIPRATAAAQRSQRQPAAVPLRSSFPSTTMPPKRTGAGGGARGGQGQRSEQPDRGRRPVLVAIAAVVGVAILIFGATRLFGGGDEAPPPNNARQTAEPTAASTAEPKRRNRRQSQAAARADTTVAVLNGTTFTGLAASTADKIQKAGFKRGETGNDSDQARSASLVTYKAGFERQARDVANELNISDIEAASADTLAVAGGSAQVVVIVGADQQQP